MRVRSLNTIDGSTDEDDPERVVSLDVTKRSKEKASDSMRAERQNERGRAVSLLCTVFEPLQQKESLWDYSMTRVQEGGPWPVYLTSSPRSV